MWGCGKVCWSVGKVGGDEGRSIGVWGRCGGVEKCVGMLGCEEMLGEVRKNVLR